MDAVPDARVNEALSRPRLQVDIPAELEARIPEEKREALKEMLALDPRPAYQDTPGREYGMIFDKRNIRFSVEDGVVTVLKADKI